MSFYLRCVYSPRDDIVLCAYHVVRHARCSLGVGLGPSSIFYVLCLLVVLEFQMKQCKGLFLTEFNKLTPSIMLFRALDYCNEA